MNETIQSQLNHRTIRQFKQEKISEEMVSSLIDVARHTASSSFTQTFSLIRVTDIELKKKIAVICNQAYVADVSELLIFVADQYRNEQIAVEQGQETSVLQNMDRFMVAMTNAVLASQNVTVAAESLGLGTVYLGSILNDSRQIIDLLELPEYTFPILGLGIGYPDQEPQLKPRLPQKFMCFENKYALPSPLIAELKDYDEVVSEYYDLRDTSRRVDSFTKQMASDMTKKPEKRLHILEEIKKQKLILE
ncbi:NADPH-dependent oxidoreductase [Vagococcus silagei]|uniref:NADPH-dependent oxidoreductase n=1 Tax=Vagococcus silagei TaxID=2508885 RepID=A0A4S3B376_9ENTE|nr:NADPH-dependent oxidoreductase [Vagococcus silagei]THB61272.1 NADPH-dependent oxidoreductase [Vagococcus silagei]